MLKDQAASITKAQSKDDNNNAGGLEEVQRVGSGSCREIKCSFSLGDQESLPSPRGQQLKAQSSQ